MVRAILAGTKTQTRRVVKDRHIAAAPPVAFFQYLRENCPYGVPGDRLWVRETHATNSHGDRAYYRADCHQRGKDWIRPMGEGAEICIGRWTPAIHMPRWASRLTLEITAVRVEQLQEIGEADAVAEGCAGGHGAIKGYAYNATPQEHYRALWESINGAGSWDANPWVWALSFRRVT